MMDIMCEGEAADPTVQLEGSTGSSAFLSQHIRMQAELEMALRSSMEMIADGPTVSTVAGAMAANVSSETEAQAPSRPRPMPPQTVRPPQAGRRQLAALRPLGAGAIRKGGEKDGDGSDGEMDDEVKSLSLSEDGPVIRRSLSEPPESFFSRAGVRDHAAAPDPIAMLTDGTRKAMLSARSVISNAMGVVGVGEVSTTVGSADGEGMGSADGEALASDRSAPNESDNSAAPTHFNEAAAAAAPASDSSLYKNLIPILSKVTGNPPPQGQLEVVQENAPDVASTASASGGAAAMMRRGWKPTKSLRVPALRSAGSNVQALDLSQIQLPAPAATAAERPQDARSDVSFGSAHSAFTCWSSSSPSSSHLNSPRHLKATVSMPTLTPRDRQ